MKNLEKEITLEFVPSSGPGGQKVNKVATAVQLRFDVMGSRCLALEVKIRLTKMAGKRITREGLLLIEARRFRTQEKNREDAIRRLYELVEKAIDRPKLRRKTKPPKNSKEARLKSKRKRSEVKKNRHVIKRDIFE